MIRNLSFQILYLAAFKSNKYVLNEMSAVYSSVYSSVDLIADLAHINHLKTETTLNLESFVPHCLSISPTGDIF